MDGVTCMQMFAVTHDFEKQKEKANKDKAVDGWVEQICNVVDLNGMIKRSVLIRQSLFHGKVPVNANIGDTILVRTRHVPLAYNELVGKALSAKFKGTLLPIDIFANNKLLT